MNEFPFWDSVCSFLFWRSEPHSKEFLICSLKTGWPPKDMIHLACHLRKNTRTHLIQMTIKLLLALRMIYHNGGMP